MTFLDAVMVREINTRAREIHFWRTLLTLLASVLFGAGWLVAKAFGVAWLVVAWIVVAVKLGWAEGRKPPPARPS
jgi:hypothetical protein